MTYEVIKNTVRYTFKIFKSLGLSDGIVNKLVTFRKVLKSIKNMKKN